MRSTESPFHRGERHIQQRLGVDARIEAFGRKVIRSFLPSQHQDFYSRLPYVFVGHADKEGWPWASILVGGEGFMNSTHPEYLNMKLSPMVGDPLSESLGVGTSLGLLGIDLSNRRRNRLSGTVDSVSEAGICLKVKQAFGNCPQYIQERHMTSATKDVGGVAVKKKEIDFFDHETQNFITNADTFFVASYAVSGGGVSDGVDVSHRGGLPGFIRVDSNTKLTIPDYTGNFHFNTLGNFIETPKAGLLFVDFDLGRVLMLTGRVEILWDSPDAEFFEGAERLWTFELDHGFWLNNAMPVSWEFKSFSQNSQLMGTWKSAHQKKLAYDKRQQWLPYSVHKVVDESVSIRSFYLKPREGATANFKAGQFLTVRANVGGDALVRTYTVSNAPGEALYRISVKREGVFSNFLHDELLEGGSIEAKAPSGHFTFDTQVDRSVVLIAAGVGITPIVSMLRHIMIEAVKTRSLCSVTLILSAKSARERAFYQEIQELVHGYGDAIAVYWALSEAEDELPEGEGYQFSGRIDGTVLQSIFDHPNINKCRLNAYVCGPQGFMQSTYDGLRSMGVDDAQIYAEAFGPATVKRDTPSIFSGGTVATKAIVSIVDAGGEQLLEQAWSEGDGTLLEFAEAHGVDLPYACRSGQCGACKMQLHSGDVAYVHAPAAELSASEVLICCTKPAAVDGDNENLIASIELRL